MCWRHLIRQKNVCNNNNNNNHDDDKKGQCTPQIVLMDHLNLLFHSFIHFIHCTLVSFLFLWNCNVVSFEKSVGDNTYQHRPTSFALTNAFQLLYYIFDELNGENEKNARRQSKERWSSKYIIQLLRNKN